MVGERKKVKFWKDKWIGGEPLSIRFPILYPISECTKSVIQEIGHWEANFWIWDLTWRRQRFVWVATMEEQLCYLLNSKSLRKGA